MCVCVCVCVCHVHILMSSIHIYEAGEINIYLKNKCERKEYNINEGGLHICMREEYMHIYTHICTHTSEAGDTHWQVRLGKDSLSSS